MKIDLHSHSEASKDGGITPEQYADLLQNEVVDCIAITDHDRIDFALGMQKALGSERIIVGQEITTSGGDIIGLFLTEKIDANLSPQETVDAIKTQGGLVCVPHPFETVRKGISLEVLDAIAVDVDIIEGYNGRAVFQDLGAQARDWGAKNGKSIVASSDAHGRKGVGYTYTVIDKSPKSGQELLAGLNNAELIFKKPPLITLLYPMRNSFLNKLKGRA